MKLNLGWFIGSTIAMSMAYRMWGYNGVWFTFGLSLQSAGLILTYRL